MKKLVTPEMASKILENNTVNRKAKTSMIAFLCEEMISGRFVYNGESIIISETNKLLDGQHRLLAIVQSKIPCYLNIEYGVSDSAMNTIDTGSARTAGDVLEINGIKHSRHIAGAIRLILDQFKTKPRLSNAIVKGDTIKISHAEILDFYNAHGATLDKCYTFCSGLYTTSIRVISPANSVAFMYLFGRNNDTGIVRSFIRELYTGVQENRSNAAVLAHKKLVNEKISAVTIRGREKTNLILYAFHKYKEGITVKQMKFSVSSIGGLKFDDINEYNQDKETK